MPNKLLEKALNSGAKAPRKLGFSEDEKELALAWVNDEVSMSQVGKAIVDLDKSSSTYTFLALCLKSIMRDSK